MWFAPDSRSPKSLRRLFLDEFAEHAEAAAGGTEVGAERAEELYGRVFYEYGDDSVAQLGGVHLACEQSSQLLAKVLERGRLAAYLEQSTRYVPYDDRPGGRWRYVVPPEVENVGLGDRYTTTLDRAFEAYARWLEPMQAFYRGLYPKDPADSDFVYRMTIRAKACDALRGLLPAATRSNVGIYATGQSYEQLLLRMRAHPLEEVRAFADRMLVELRKVIPAFERTGYRFDVLCDYGAFRDLQRHRPLTIEWQRLSPRHGYEMPPEIEEAGVYADWTRTMRESEELWSALREVGDAAQYAVAMAYRIRFVMDMNAREAMHVIELRTTPQGHPVYRRVGQGMHRLIAEEAGHRAIAEAMRFVDHTRVELERLDAERRSDARRRAMGTA